MELKKHSLEWHVYILSCSDKTLYTGITTDLDRRLNEHNLSDKGAKYTKSRRPVKLVYSHKAGGKSDAAKEEDRIKRLSRSQKLEIIEKLNKSK